MKNTIRILSTSEMKPLLDSIENKYLTETEYFLDSEGHIASKIACMQPDVVIMNLFVPEGDAIEIIKAYRLLYAKSSIYFAVIVPFVTGSLKRELDECGVNRVICKPYYRRDLDAVLAEVSQLKTTPLASLKSAGIHTVHTLHHRHTSCLPETAIQPEAAIDEIFKRLGLNNNDVGGRYLKRAVQIAVCGEKTDFSVTKRIYPAVAAEFGTTPSCVERRIRGAIAEAWRSDRSAVITAYFGYTVDNMRGKPTNSEFIAMLADRIRLDMASADSNSVSYRERQQIGVLK